MLNKKQIKEENMAGVAFLGGVILLVGGIAIMI